ncbi:SGS-domain-containing protein [Xylaria palmicola]|nr:SGS-domain-containing protein [Xylaria palmicola]
MSSSHLTNVANQGIRANSQGKYAEAADKLTQALAERQAPRWFLERSKAYLRTNQPDLALRDAENGLCIALERANRTFMTEAQIRRAIALFRLGRFADADVVAFWAIRLTLGAKATEDDGQQNKVDDNGDYTERAKELKGEKNPNEASLLNSVGPQTTESSLRNQALTWRAQALTQMEKLPAGHDGRKVHNIIKYPARSQGPAIENPPQPSLDEQSNPDNTPKAIHSMDTWEDVWSLYNDMYTRQKIRCSFYQTETSVTVDFFVKNLSPEQISVESESRAIKISPVQGVSLGSFTGPIILQLSGDIRHEATRYTVKSMKIELVLQKLRAGKWPALRREDADIVDNLSISPSQGADFARFSHFITANSYKEPSELELPHYDSDPPAWYRTLLETLQSKMSNESSSPMARVGASTPTGTVLPTQSQNVTAGDSPADKPASATGQETKVTKQSGGAPAYPTSSRNGPKDWDAVDDEDEEEATNQGDVNSFFQQLYQGADEDTKRAMMKSFVESNGTALSTSWDDAKSKTYKTSPPDGAEAKKWD